MPQKRPTINVILHAPTDQKSLNALQEIADEFYARLIERDLSRYDLTQEEKEQVIRQVAANLG